MLHNNNCLALFDFDGTISNKDSFLEFIKFCKGKKSFYLGMILHLPMLMLMKLKIIPNQIAKEKILIYFFKNEKVEKLQKLGNDFGIQYLPKIIRPKAIEKINWHKKKNHTISLVSASSDLWLKNWAEAQKIDLIATKLEISNGKITGKINGKNCKGIEKVNRIKEKYDLKSFEKIYAYGDSRGDKEMLAIADEAFFKPF